MKGIHGEVVSRFGKGGEVSKGDTWGLSLHSRRTAKGSVRRLDFPCDASRNQGDPRRRNSLNRENTLLNQETSKDDHEEQEKKEASRRNRCLKINNQNNVEYRRLYVRIQTSSLHVKIKSSFALNVNYDAFLTEDTHSFTHPED
ncbi:hypothetical protein KM043_007161 [Ampulex compressa]|nr:hypothetical protein KM043_007161 [Ampulex compressa]